MDPTWDDDETGMLDFDKNKEIFIKALTQKVLRAFKRDLIKVQAKRYVTFKNATSTNENLFDYYEQLDIVKHLRADGIKITDSKTHIVSE